MTAFRRRVRWDGNQRERNDGLDVGGVTHRVRRAVTEVPVVLNRHLNQACDGVLKFFGKFGVFGLVVLVPLAALSGGRSLGGREGERVEFEMGLRRHRRDDGSRKRCIQCHQKSAVGGIVWLHWLTGREWL